MYYLYIIIFKRSQEKSIGNDVNQMHKFDNDLCSILPGLEYCLHLPRLELDFEQIDVMTMENAYDIPQNIRIFPDDIYAATQVPFMPTLVIYEDGICAPAMEKMNKETSLLEPLPISMLSEEMLINHWSLLSEKRKWATGDCATGVEVQHLLKGRKMNGLPALFAARQLDCAEEVYDKISNTRKIYQECAEITLTLLSRHALEMKRIDMTDYQEKMLIQNYNKELKKISETVHMNVVVTMPGIPYQQAKRMNCLADVPEIEKRVIRIIALHRAIAKKALLVEIPVLPDKLFSDFNELELNIKNGGEIGNQNVHRLLRKIGKTLEENLSTGDLWALWKAKHITVFSDFPLGMAVFEKTDSILQCYKNISYRPLTPLTMALQIEMPKRKQLYLKRKCKIIFAECVINDCANKYIRVCSEGITKPLEENAANSECLEYIYKETLTVFDLKQFIYDNSDADILHISAHGHYDHKQGFAGIFVGEELWMAKDIDFRVPPIVILSACHVSPRGKGAENVTDAFMRLGAETVLGTFIPISALRNTILLGRFYTYVLEAQKGNKQYQTLADLWQGIVSTNAIHEIMEANVRLENWLMETNTQGNVRLIDFEQNRSVGRLHGPNSYGETIEILKEMLKEEGLEGKYSDVLDQRNYFPESFFYQWIGYPENMFLYNKTFDLAAEKHII